MATLNGWIFNECAQNGNVRKIFTSPEKSYTRKLPFAHRVLPSDSRTRPPPKNPLESGHLAQNKCDMEISAEAFGKRVMIFGPSAFGKSTMAVALGEKPNIPVYHIDRLCFFPGTFWEPRPAEEFRELHEKVINSDE
jgi:hypothetical protein